MKKGGEGKERREEKETVKEKWFLEECEISYWKPN